MIAILLVALFAVCHADMYQWADFKETYGRYYIDEPARYECFKQNLAIIDELNKEDTAVHSTNQFSDLCADEFKTYHNLVLPNKTDVKRVGPLPVISSGAVDWRKTGAVTHVKNQAQCGSCWAFSTTGNLEGQHFKQTGRKSEPLSEQMLVSCSKKNGGCRGGLMDYAFDYVTSVGGIATEDEYPYTSGNGYTGTCKNSKVHATVKFSGGHTDIAQNEQTIASWVQAHGPLSIAVDASVGWQTYRSGIKSTCSVKRLDHGVLIVGYGTESGTDYWIVKNSWSSSWGESGYIRLRRGEDCNGLSQSASSIVRADVLASL